MTSAAWTDQHNEFCLKHQLPASVRALWQWLLEAKEETGCEIEFNLKQFNAWVERWRGKAYDPKTLKSAAERLLEIGAFIDEKCTGFTWFWKRWIVRPINLLVSPLKPRKKVQQSGKIPDPCHSNPQSVVGEDIAAAAIPNSEILDACEQAGIPFRKSEAGNLLKNSMSDVLLAIAHFWCRGGHEKIENPQGWLIECLRRRWWEDVTDNYYSAHSPIARRQTLEWERSGCLLEER